ncbi:MAG TPA: CBS domain-containing protein [Acidimicrobiia bacterium]|nr:CBS domain-containing protein [Acidimicrobiia bacterium]
MKVRELMTTELITVGSHAPLKEAARRMIEGRVSGLLVTDRDGKLIGVITEADFVKAESDRRASKRARLLRWFSREVDEIPSTERLVGDVMTRDVVVIGPEADHAEAARLMRKAEVKRIPVVDEDRLIGIVSRSDILRAFARSDMAIIGEIVDHVIGDVLWINPSRVDVRSIDGNVTLKGRLETKSDATLLAELTRRVDGVVSLDTDLTWEIDNTKVEMVAPPPSGLSRSNWR